MFARILVALLVSFSAHAEESNEYLFGSLTQHFINFDGVSEKYDNKVSADGTLIANPIAAYRLIKTEGVSYDSTTYFAGQNSVGELMGGAMFNTGYNVGCMRLGALAGAYVQDNKKFTDRGLVVFSMPIDRYGIVPVVGVEVSFIGRLNKRTYVTLVNIITPILATSTVGIGFDL